MKWATSNTFLSRAKTNTGLGMAGTLYKFVTLVYYSAMAWKKYVPIYVFMAQCVL